MTEPTEIEKDAETCQDGLALLAGVGVCTPEEGYGSNIQWLMSDLKSAFRERDAEIKRLKSENRVMHRFARDEIHQEVWHWQGDDYDFPESLTCPVIMDCNTLREFLAKIETLKQVFSQIKDNALLVLNSQPGQERKVLEEIVFIIDKTQLAEATNPPPTESPLTTRLNI